MSQSHSKSQAKQQKIADLSSEDKSLLGEVRNLKAELSKARRTVNALQQSKRVYRTEMGELRKQLGDMETSHPEVVALADDFPAQFSKTGKSEYLRSVLLPDVGPAYIPDDIVQQCHAKSETVTYNLAVADSGAGVLIIYPDHPTNLIGYHYTQNALGAFVYDRALRTAQNLPDNYDYARRVSQLVTVKSSTIPSGVYALNGTFNAVRVEGTLSEVPSLQANGDEFYNALLTNTVDLYDKAGNVLVGDGIAVLSLLSGVDQSYTRLADASPISIAGSNVSTLENSINDMSQSLKYHLLQTGNFTFSPGTTNNLTTVMNVDSTTGVIVDASINLTWPGNPVTAYTIALVMDFLDPFGNVIATPTSGSSAFVQNTEGSLAVNLAHQAVFHYSFQNYDGPPIAAIRFHVNGFGQNTPQYTANMVVKFDATVPNAARPGVNKPVTLIAYQGVAAGSVLTLSGVTNFELIPNPVLRQNLQLENSYADERELEYAKGMLHNRHLVGLKSVWALKDYWASRPILEELADATTHDVAMALSGADIVKFLKQKVLPFIVKPAVDLASKALPAAAPVFNALGKAVTTWSGSAASGVPVASAASGYPMVPARRRGRFTANAMDRKPTVRAPKLKPGVIVPVRWRAVAFPVILTHPGSLVMTGGMLFIATNTKPVSFKSVLQTRSIDGQTVFGLGRDDIYQHRLGCDIWLIAVDPAAFLKGRLLMIDSPGVDGHSADTAIYLAAHGKFCGATTVPITGGLDLNLNVEPNPAFDAKKSWLAVRGIPLAGNAEDAHPKVTNISQVLNGIHVFRTNSN